MKVDVGKIINGVVDLIKNNPLVLAPQLVAALLTFVLSLVIAESLVNNSGYIEGDFDSFVSGINWGALAAFVVSVVIINLLAYGISLGMACDMVETGVASIGGGLARFFSRIGHLFLAAILVSIMVSVGLVLCILPGLVAIFFLMFVFVGIVYSKRGAIDAISGSINVVKKNVPDALVFLLIMFGITFSGGLAGNVMGLIPVVGSLASSLLQAALSVFATVLLVKVYAELLALDAPEETVIPA